MLNHFELIEDDRESWRAAHPLPEVLLLAVCGTLAAGDDFDDIAD
ncbi:MAG: transposase family protein [Rhizobiaceae bacterium]|nr:transposase family protein [Rhizobiaceae bacterium]